MKLPKNKSLNKFYQLNKMYNHSPALNEGFFGELFRGIMKAFAALFGIEIDENADSSYSSSGSTFNSTARRAISNGDVALGDLKLPDDTDVEKLNWEDFDPDNAPDEESREERIKLRDAVMAEVLRIELEGVGKAISSLSEVPAFLEGVDDRIVESRIELIKEQKDQYEKYETEMAEAGAGFGKLIGVSRFVNDKIPEFEFIGLDKPKTPGDLVQQSVYYATKLQPKAKDNTGEPQEIIDFGVSYSQKNGFELMPDTANHVPSKSVEGDHGEAIQSVADEAEELTPEQIEELDPSDYILLDDSEIPNLPKDGAATSLMGWFDSLSKTSKLSLKIGGRMDKLTTGIFSAIDKSVDSVTKEVEDAIGLWRSENEEALIKSKRFAKKNFDSLQSLVPKMVATVIKKTNESNKVLTRKSIRSFVNTTMTRYILYKELISENSDVDIIKEYHAHMTDGGGGGYTAPAPSSPAPSSGSAVGIELTVEADDEDFDPEKEADPTDEIKAVSKSNLTAKDAVNSMLDKWGSSLSPTSQQSLKQNLKGDTLKDIIFTAVDSAAEIVAIEVEKSVKDWRAEHEEILVRSKRFAKKNFDSLEDLIPDLVSKIIKKTNESKFVLTKNGIRKIVYQSLDFRFLKPEIINESRWSKLAGIVY